MSRKNVVVLSALSALLLATTAFAQPPGGTIYAHDVAYSTIATPADLPPVGKFDNIYVLGSGLANVADAAPGDQAYNGGRWAVQPITWLTISPTQFTNAEQVHMAARRGEIRIEPVIRNFECPLIPKRGNRH